MGLFNKKKKDEGNERSLIVAKDKIVFYKVTEKSDEELFKISDMIIGGKPVLVNFDSLVANDCNFMLAFLSGVVYGYNGEAIPMAERCFLFARGSEFEDGSLEAWIEDNK